jgi:hypothetical protein
MSRLVKIYRSPRQPDMYLYVDSAEDLQRVPDKLLERFGTPVETMSLELAAERKLARADAGAVLRSIDEAGYYLQLPPSIETL